MAGWTALVAISVLFAGILILLGMLILWSCPGKPKPFVDEHGAPRADSIREKVFIKINGLRQGMFIESRVIANPVLLFLHGGPGMPEYFLTECYPTGLEDHFTVAWWEQRGAGLSFSPDIPLETMTYEQVISDTLEVANYLRQRFGKEKIYLMAHSGGSFFGIQAAARAPELFHAYIAIAQMSYQLASEKLAYDYALSQYKKFGNLGMLRKLEAAPPSMTIPLPAAYDRLRDPYMHDLGIGTTREMKSVVSGVFLPSWKSRIYTLPEKIDLWRGKFFSMHMLRNVSFSTDLTQKVRQIDIPVYFFSGIHDYTVNYGLTKEYFQRLQAPIKGFYTFEHSAHSPMFEEPQKVVKIMLEDILEGTNRLADR